MPRPRTSSPKPPRPCRINDDIHAASAQRPALRTAGAVEDMGGLIGARIPRLEDGALLTGKGRFVDDIALPGVLHAAFVRSPHPHAAIRRIDARDALALPGVHAVLTLDDLAPVLAQRRMLRHSNSGTPLDRFWSFALADGEVSYVGEAVALVLADNRYVAEDAAALVAVDYDVLPAVSDCRKAIEPAAPAVRRELNTNVAAAYKVAYGDVRSRLQQGRARLPRGALAASRRRPSDRRPRDCRGRARRRRRGLGVDPEGARPVPVVDRAARFRREPAARGDPGRRRRLRSQALRLFRGHRRGGGGQAARALDQMDRGSARAFHQRRAGARPVLVDRHRGRRRCQAAWHPRPADPRSRRLRAAGREHSLQLGVDDERAVSASRPVHRRHRRRHQQDAGVVGARRRLSAGSLRHGAADGPRRARIAARARRAAPAQSHPAGEDALHQAAQGALRRQHAVRQRRLSGLPGAGAAGGRLGGFPPPASRRAQRAPLSRHRAGARHQGHRPRSVRVRIGAGLQHRTCVGVHRRRRDRTGSAHRARADLRRRARPARRGHHRGPRRYQRRGARARRLRQPPDRDRRFVRAAGRAGGRRQGEEAREPRAGGGRARSRDRGRRGARGRRAAARGQARRARAHPQGRSRLRLPRRHRPRPRRQRQLAHRCARLCQCLPRRRGRGRPRHRRRQASANMSRCRTPEP